MSDSVRLLGIAELLGAVLLVSATFTLSVFTPGADAADPLAWRMIAVFMAASGVTRLRGDSAESCLPSPT